MSAHEEVSAGQPGAAESAAGGTSSPEAQAPRQAPLQKTTTDYRSHAVSAGPARVDAGASAELIGSKARGLQNATTPAQSQSQPPPAPGTPPPAQPTSLAARQRDAIELIVLGRSDRAVADAVRVHRVTVTKWRLYDPAFQAALNRRRQERWDADEQRVRALLRRAVRVIDRQLRCDDPDVSFRAAKALVQMAGAGRFAPSPAPTDPLAVLDVFARARRVERKSNDPATDALTDRDRGLALRDLRMKRGALEREEADPDA